MNNLKGKAHNDVVLKAMYGTKRATGGGVGDGDAPTSNMSDNMPRFKEGGDAMKKKGGRCYATGGKVEQEDEAEEAESHRKGGRAKKKSNGREEHSWGDFVGGLKDFAGAVLPFASTAMHFLKEGGPASSDDAPMKKRGGCAHKRHAEGDTVEKKAKGGRL